MVDKLAKAMVMLKHFQTNTSIEDPSINKKDKMFFCALIAELMVSLKVINTQNLSLIENLQIIENMINLCDDKDSDVRMVADESLNKIIMSLSEINMNKVHIELYKVIKKNGPARCVRAALSRFGQLSHLIRPSKGFAYVHNLIPSLVEISKREEESIHETLASSLENIFKVLGVFAQDSTLKSLLKAFLHNLSSGNPVIRRCSASCIITVVQYCRKPHIFNSFVLNSLLDCVVPICESNSTYLILGVLGCLRLLLPTLCCVRNEEGISGSFGLRRKQDESVISVDRLIQTYELCLHYTNSKDHNVVAAALETLNQILQNPPKHLESFFLSPAGFSRSYIHSAKENKLRSRSGSEMSVAFSLPSMDESLMLDVADIAPATTFGDFPAGESSTTSKAKDRFGYTDDVENLFKDKVFGEVLDQDAATDIDSDTESLAALEVNSTSTNFTMKIETEDKDLEDFVEYSMSNSREDLHSPNESVETDNQTAIDVGNFTDPAIPLIYCARHLAASFLLDGSPGCLKSDRNVRVSIKSLALSCFSAIIKLYPVVMKMNLAKSQNLACTQEISDVLLFCNHSDPQIRGCVNVLIGYFINSALIESKGCTSDWLSDDKSTLNCDNLTSIIAKGLKDKSSVCTRQALSAVKLCINMALLSVYNRNFLPLLEDLPALTNNSYWLVKVKLAKVIGDLPFVCIHDLTNSNTYQEEVIDSVLIPLLGDEDSRVRSAASEALVRAIPILYCGKSTVQAYTKSFTEQFNKWLNEKKTNNNNNNNNNLSPFPPFSYILMDPDDCDYDQKVEASLSRIVSKLTYALLVPENKHFLFGYLEALKVLSQKYPTTVYVKGWNCWKPKMEKAKEDRFLASNLLPSVLSLLITSPLLLDLAAFSNATFLLGNLFAGHCIPNLKYNYQIESATEGDAVKLWDLFKSEKLSQIAEETLTHLLKVLNIYSRLAEEVPLSSTVADSSNTSNSFIPMLYSPIKKQEKKSEDKSDDKKTKNSSNNKQTNQYAKLQKLLKSAYANYKVSLDKSVGDKFLDLLESTLYSLSVILEVSTVQETGRCAEEILSYLRASVTLRPNPTVLCVVQLLKSLFGTNLAYNWEEKKVSSISLKGVNLFDSIFQLPTELISEKIRKWSNVNSLESDNLTGVHRRTERKIYIKNTDKNWLATCFKLLEPMFIKTIHLYTITGDEELQSNVLKLLNQMIQPKVNYCLLDAQQVFVGFVLKQFELIESGFIPRVEILLPHIFKFLVLLSYEKQHSKPITSIPKILHLCDRLMASDQSVQTHCIPALVPLVEDVFLSRSYMSTAEENELETQKEVLLSMLLRLAEFPRVMDMLSVILNHCKTVKDKERWKRWSAQVMETILSLAHQDCLRIETFEGQNSFSRLMSSLSPNVLKQISPLVRALFAKPFDLNCSTSLLRWLSRVTVLLETVLFVREDALLNTIEEILPNVPISDSFPNGNAESADPLNLKFFLQSSEPVETAARFIFRIINVVANKILDSVSVSQHLQQKLSMFFVCVYHILRSGTFHKITNALQNFMAKEQESATMICSLFLKMLHVCPALTCQFSYFLALLNYCDDGYWSRVLSKPLTLSAKLVQSSSVISLCDYLCDNPSDSETLHRLLLNNIHEVILLSHEIPVKELLLTIRRKKPDWSLMMETIASKDFESTEPEFVEKLLRLLEMSDNSHSASLLVLLVNKFLSSPRLALSLLAGAIACRQVEYLLTLPKEKVLEQINGEVFSGLMNFFDDKKYLKRHYTLWSLLNRLGVQVFQISLTELNKSQTIDTEQLKRIELHEDWYFNQIKQRCCQKSYPGIEITSLLSKLSYERILEIISTSGFNIRILKDCLMYPELVRQKHELQEQDNKHYKSYIINDSLHKASKYRLLEMINDVKRKLGKVREELPKEATKSEQVLDKLISSEEGLDLKIWEMATCLKVLLGIIRSENSDVETEYLEGVAEFGILCLEMMERDVEKGKKEGREEEMHLSNVETGLKCCSAVLKSRKIGTLLSQPKNRERLKDCVGATFRLVGHLIPTCRFSKILNDKNLSNDQDELAQLEFLLDFVLTKSISDLLPNYLMNCLRELVLGLCRVPELSLQVLKVPESCDMQNIDILENFITRFSVIGWSSRQQFEEIWVALLAVLGLYTQSDVPFEEAKFIVQINAAAVEGITSLLKNTMLDSGSKKLIHHGRDSLSMKNTYEKLPLVHNAYRKDQYGDRVYHFLDNLEISRRDDRHIQGLLSVEYLWTAVKQISSQVDLYEKHTKELRAAGLDIPSCIHLLLELYNQWIFQASPDIKIISSSLKSSLVISDLFTDISQFQWMLNFCIRIDEIVINEDTVILPLIILGSCKAGAIVLPDNEICEKIKKLMLRSSSIPCRIATVQGLLYLLQSYIVCYAVNHTALPPPGSAFQADEANFVANVVDAFLPVALDVIQQFKPHSGLIWEPIMEEYDRCHWSLMFYLLQHYQSSLGDLKEDFFNQILNTLRNKNCSDSTLGLLVRGTERLLLTTVIDENFRDQLSKISLEILSHNSHIIARHGLQLLTVLSFLDKRVKDIRQLVTGQDDSEKLMKDMEKINVLFEKLKKSYPKEAEVVGDVISYILMDFSASDILTKVIQEFLSTHQPHQKILAGLLFKVFERAELSLLEDWVVFSLPSFIQGLPIAMSIWTLNCFFVSASSEPWLRSLFPLVQSRIRMAESEDRKLLCLSGAHFYKQLKQESQRKSFIETFEKAAKTDNVFVDLLSSLR